MWHQHILPNFRELIMSEHNQFQLSNRDCLLCTSSVLICFPRGVCADSAIQVTESSWKLDWSNCTRGFQCGKTELSFRVNILMLLFTEPLPFSSVQVLLHTVLYSMEKLRRTNFGWIVVPWSLESPTLIIPFSLFFPLPLKVLNSWNFNLSL